MFTKGTEVLSVVRLHPRFNRLHRVRGYVIGVRPEHVAVGVKPDSGRPFVVLKPHLVKPIVRRGWSTTKKDWAAGHKGMAKR